MPRPVEVQSHQAAGTPPGLGEQRLTRGHGGDSDCRRGQALRRTPGVNDLCTRRCSVDNPPGRGGAEVRGRSTGESGARKAGWCPCRCWWTWVLRGLARRSPVRFCVQLGVGHLLSVARNAAWLPSLQTAGPAGSSTHTGGTAQRHGGPSWGLGCRSFQFPPKYVPFHPP